MFNMASLIEEKKYCWRYAFILASLLSLLILVSSPSIMANPKSPLVVKIESFSFPPILHTSESGEFSGTMGETVKMLCEAGDMICSFDVVPLKRAYKNIKAGRTDALITIGVGQLKKCCIASDWSSPWTAGFFSATGLNEIPETPEDLPGRSLIVVLGMKSPYLFAQELDKMDEEKHLNLLKASDILSSVRMFLANRAPLLWGGEDFEWYFKKVDAEAKYYFKPVVELPVVIWINKEKPKVLARFNQAFRKINESNILNDKFLLRPQIMEKRYLDAVLPR
jgi:hypothetical protein